jgi:type IX secretion system PorP/SprF family membrane protein
MKTRAIFSITLLLYVGILNAQQTPYRSPLGSTDFLYNPALSAAEDFMEFGAFYRHQWMGFEGAPVTAQAFIHVPVMHRRMSAGGFVQNDRLGPFSNNSFALTYAYKTEIGLNPDDQLSLGLSASFQQYQFSGNRNIIQDQDDPLAFVEMNRNARFNAGFGLFYTSKYRFEYDENWWFFGLAANQLVRSKIPINNGSLAHINRVIAANISAGMRKPIGVSSFIEPSIWVHFTEPLLFSYSANLNFETEDAFWAGISYATGKQIALQTGFILKDGILQDGRLRLGVLGGYNLQQLANNNSFGMELLLSYRFAL